MSAKTNRQFRSHLPGGKKEVPAPKRREVLRGIASQIKPSSFIDFRVFIFSLYRMASICIKNYTYEQFAFDIGLSNASEVENIILGKLPLNRLYTINISTKLGFSVVEREYLEKLIDNNVEEGHGGESLPIKELINIRLNSAETLNTEQMNYFDKWYIPVVGEYLKLPDASRTPEGICSAIVPSLKLAEVKAALKVLVNTGMVTHDVQNNTYHRTPKDLSTDYEVSGLGLQAFHQQALNLSKHALRTIGQYEREISSLTFSVSRNLAIKIKSMIQEFEDQILFEEQFDKNKKDAVHQLNIQFFPVSKQTKDDT